MNQILILLSSKKKKEKKKEFSAKGRRFLAVEVELNLRYLGRKGDWLWWVKARWPWSPIWTETAAALVSANRFASAVDEIFGDGVRQPAATSSSGGDMTVLLNIPNIIAEILLENSENFGKKIIKMKCFLCFLIIK